jgi:hypothetical protein
MSISMCEFQQRVLMSGTGRHAWQMGGPAPQRFSAFAAIASILRHPAHGIISARGTCARRRGATAASRRLRTGCRRSKVDGGRSGEVQDDPQGHDAEGDGGKGQENLDGRVHRLAPALPGLERLVT